MPGPPAGERPAHLVLVGMMGAGKSSVARLLGQRLGRPVVDTDDLVVEATGRSIRATFEQEGEAAFRQHELVAIRQAMAADVPSVVSLGGGAVTTSAGRAAVADATVVWLRARPETLAARVADGDGRPLLDGRDALGRLRALDEERAAAYAAAADLVIDVDALALDEVAQRILASVAT